ncbi:choline transporter [Nosocomiicoccus sp. HMSC067E10]|nr:BCCT family transporter [Nosocomiicoccus sp. HMSC067E10]OFL48388.1 choline transporter [Nosocomiicoccus sp. HMSC067E10]
MLTDNEGKRLTNVFKVSVVVVLLLVLIGVFFPKEFGNIAGKIANAISVNLGWYYMIIMTGFIFFCIFLSLSPIGKLKLGKPDEKPEFRTISWLAMLFSAGMGIGLVFYGASEPISHMVNPSTGEGGKDQALEAMRATIMHWGIHAWAAYGVVALALAYAAFRKEENGLISKTLRPIFGDKVDGWLGTIIDVLAVFATVVGVAVSLGVGTLQINGGLTYLFGIPNGFSIQLIIIIIVTILFLLSAYTGLSKGIQLLSNTNMVLAGILFLIVLIVGPTLAIFTMMTTSTGVYLQEFMYQTLDSGFNNPQKSQWLQDWTIYYWGWWLSWTPFVGVFIARVSRGRTIREFVLAVMLVPTLIAIVWFSVFGTTGMNIALQFPGIAELAPEEQLFAIFDKLPLGTLLSVIAIFLVAVFFITSADSATFVLGMQTSNGSLQPSTIMKVIWGISLSAIAVVLLLAGGEEALSAIQSAAIIAALPFSVVIILMVIAFFKDANNERKYLGLTIRPDEKQMKEYLSRTPQEHSQDILDYIDETSDQKGI